jgi:hypothetical protein
MKLTWRSMHEVLTKLTEEEVLKLLQEEQAGANRIAILTRLHQRYSSLRVERERVQLLRGAATL